MATPNYLSSINGFLPQPTGQAIAYVRDPKKFKINEYVQIVKSPTTVAAYAVLDPDAPVRVVTDQEFDWPDNQPRPKPGLTQGDFVWVPFTIFRRDYGYQVGEQAIATAKGWNPRGFFNAIVLSLAMTNRTNRFVKLLENTTNWAGNTSDANVLNNGAGNWVNASNDPLSPNYLAIKRSLLKAMQNVDLSTNGQVSVDEMRLVISPPLACAIAETSEIHDYLKDNVNSIRVIEGKDPQISNGHWGVPDYLYGVKLIVENASIVTQRPNSSHTYASLGVGRTYIKQSNSAVLLSRPGGLDGTFGAPSFSTCQGYFYEYELAVEAFHEVKDKLFETHVVDQFQEVLAATRAGWLITGTS